MKSLERVKKDNALAIKQAKAGKIHWPSVLKDEVAELYNSKKYSSSEIATFLNLRQRQITSWGRRAMAKTKKGRSGKTEDDLLKAIMSGIDNPVEKEKLDAIHTKCSRIENDFWEALDEKDASLTDLRSYAAGLLKEVINIADFIEDKIEKL